MTVNHADLTLLTRSRVSIATLMLAVIACCLQLCSGDIPVVGEVFIGRDGGEEQQASPDLKWEEKTLAYGSKQRADGQEEIETYRRIKQAHKYMVEQVAIESIYDSVRESCKNRDELCSFWAGTGECEKNSDYMRSNCSPACFSCSEIQFNRVGRPWQAGDLNNFFERLTTLPYYQQYRPTIITKPGVLNSKTKKDSPWIVSLDEFLNEEECRTLMRLGEDRGFEVSSAGAKDTSVIRTGTNTWCKEECADHPLTKQILRKIENVTAMSATNYEQIQLVRYNEGQFYGKHHDFIYEHVNLSSGPRILTMFIYLTDVEQGGKHRHSRAWVWVSFNHDLSASHLIIFRSILLGGTHFSNLDMTVTPKRGKCLIWPSVLDKHPSSSDYRTFHEALAVEHGVKYGANVWVSDSSFCCLAPPKASYLSCADSPWSVFQHSLAGLARRKTKVASTHELMPLPHPKNSDLYVNLKNPVSNTSEHF
jgi:prolyl 4-hydroxylase